MTKSKHPKLDDLKILIVEDDETSSEYLKELLEEYEVSLVFADNAEDAVSICKQQDDIDLVLMDILLPGKSGYEAIQEIREINQNLPIIAQTAYAFERDKNKALNSGFNGFISKPIRPAKLIDVIEETLRLS